MAVIRQIKDGAQKSVSSVPATTQATRSDYHPQKAIILGAGRGDTSGITQEGTPTLPKCLLSDPFGKRVLDWILASLKNLDIKKIDFVGGYRIDDIGKLYNSLDFTYNPEWEHGGVLSSLYHVREEFTEPLLISYSDIVYRSSACEHLLSKCTDQITIAVDSSWRKRNSQTVIGPVRKNLALLDNSEVSQIGFLDSSQRNAVEFVGLVHFGPQGLIALRDFFNNKYSLLAGTAFQQATDVRTGFLTDLLRHFIATGITVTAVDIGDEWAEMDSPERLAEFVMGTKGDTLERLASLIKKGRFCKQQIYTVRDWQQERERVLANINRAFAPDPIVVRSSTSAEDSWEHSFAGSFQSILNVITTADSITEAINKVVTSYARHGLAESDRQQILVQGMLQDVIMSGVVFTRDLTTGAPYYVINYDDSSERTDTVTSGTSADTRVLYVARTGELNTHDAHINKLLEVVRELEDVTGCSALDIEFAIDVTGEVYILQTRPLTVFTKEDCFRDQSIEKELSLLREFISNKLRRSPGLYGKTTILADMPDWNPAEMIGSSPSPLALSLYQRLITDSAWRIARDKIGYFHPSATPLMVSIGGHPYIDVRASFNSLLPKGLPPALAEKLVNHYVNRLTKHPELHDKIEFEICHTCLTLNFGEDSVRLIEDGFSMKEVDTLENALLTLTNNIIGGEHLTIANLIDQVSILNKRRQEILKATPDVREIPSAIHKLLYECETYGTVPFAILARYAFVAQSFLRSLVSRQLLTSKEREAFSHSIDSVATDLIHDLDEVFSKRLSLKEFLVTYGHLRPGTYDITSYRYDERPESYFPDSTSGNAALDKPHSAKAFFLSSKAKAKIQQALSDGGFTFSVDELFYFMRRAISLREWAKFEFTKVISDILVLMERLGKEFGFSREEMAFVNIDSVRGWASNEYAINLGELLRNEISSGKALHERARALILPHMLRTPNDIEVIKPELSRPNYVTLGRIAAPLMVLKDGIDPKQLSGKIVLIEGADPGFDWVFAHRIAGLITKYGGAGSHMTIRAAEFGIPAAIGCGELLYNRLSSAKTLELDCAGETVRITS